MIDTYQTEISVENYLNYFDTAEKLTIFEISLSDSKEQKIKSAIEGTEGRTFLQCAVRASIREFNFKTNEELIDDY